MPTTAPPILLRRGGWSRREREADDGGRIREREQRGDGRRPCVRVPRHGVSVGSLSAHQPVLPGDPGAPACTVRALGRRRSVGADRADERCSRAGASPAARAPPAPRGDRRSGRAARDAGDAGSAAPLSPLASVRVVGSGPIAWGKRRGAQRAEPRAPRSSRRSRSSGPTSIRARCWRSTSAVTPRARPTWYRISVPGRPNGRTGWIPAGGGRRQARRPLARGLPRVEEVRALRRRAPAADGARCRRRARDGDADRALLRAVDVRAEQVPDPRGVRVRDERLLEALRLARRRRGRRPRDEHAVADRPGGLPRLRPPAEQRRPRAAQARRASARRSRSSARRLAAGRRYAADAASNAYAWIGSAASVRWPPGAGRS